MLKVNGVSVVDVDHYQAVEVLKACGAVLVLHVSREITRLVGHPVFGEDGSVAQISVTTGANSLTKSPVVVNIPVQEVAKTIPPPLQIYNQQDTVQTHEKQQSTLLATPNSNGVLENGRVN